MAKILMYLSLLITLEIMQRSCVDAQNGKGHFKHFSSFDGSFSELEETSEFDVVHPMRLDDRGHFLTHDVHYVSKRRDPKTLSRKRRHTHERSSETSTRLLYSIPRGDHILTLNLTENLLLTPEDFVIERMTSSNGTKDSFMTSSISRTNRWPCHFRGHVEGKQNSRVALSTCNGLTGLLITEEGEFFIEPIKDTAHFSTSANVDPRSQAHKIYRRDLSSILDKAEPMLHYEKLIRDDKLAHLKHIQGETQNTNNPSKPNTIIDPLQMESWHSALFDEPHEKEFCGVLDTKRKYRRIIRKREQWEAKRENTGSNSNSNSSRRRSKRSVSVKRMIEMMVAVDKKMVEHYEANENGGVEKYVLTVINMVSEIFRDASIGNSLEISLVRLILLEDETKGPKITTNAENTLDSFCRWAKKVNPRDDSHPNHHDVAILLTRQEICSQSNKSCETLGLAHVAGMCQSHRSCNVNQDTGLSLAYTVAHELGHNFAMHHDGQLNDCRPSPKYNHVMAPHITSSSLPMIWSSCSRKYITRFLDRNWGFCLNDQPAEHEEFTPPASLPGVVYDADHQCRLMFGEKSRHCFGIDDICHRLWCYHGGTCRSRLHAAAPGTQCAKGRWCYGGKCVSMSKDVKVIDGGWGAWSSWSGCSRTCGIGVSSSLRYCDNPLPQNGGEYCVGERKRYKTCSKWRCRSSPGSMTFREQQCAAFNNVKYKNMTFSWKPVDSALYPCELHCYTRAGRIPFADRLRDKVIDGTKCFPGSNDICVDGICRRVGCDKNIGSRALEDRCGVCHGNGSTCFEVRKTFTRKKGEEYTPIALLPLGARNIDISEVAPVMNFLALRHATNKTQYYLNGNYMIQWDTKFQLAGTQFTYRRINETVDTIAAPGPLTEEIMLVVLFVEENPGVLIEYSKPYVYNPNKSNEEEFPEFKWKIQDWSECTTECGKGHQVMSPVCVEKKAGIVEDSFCNDTERPEVRRRSCNDIPCPARWSTSRWEDCSVTCGSKAGIQRRLVMCVRSVGEGDEVVLNHTLCSESERPTNKRRCRLHTEIPCPVWRPGDWQQCSETCGGGVKNRTVECVTYLMNEVIDLDSIDDDEADSMEIEEINIQNINVGSEVIRSKPTKKPKKNGKRKVDSSKNAKHANLLRGKGLLMSIEMDPLLYDIDLDGYDVEKDELCDFSKKPSAQETCNTDACPTTTSPIVETSARLDWTTFSQFIRTTPEDIAAEEITTMKLNSASVVDNNQMNSTTEYLVPSNTPQDVRTPAGMLNRKVKVADNSNPKLLITSEIEKDRTEEPTEIAFDYTSTTREENENSEPETSLKTTTVVEHDATLRHNLRKRKKIEVENSETTKVIVDKNAQTDEHIKVPKLSHKDRKNLNDRDTDITMENEEVVSVHDTTPVQNEVVTDSSVIEDTVATIQENKDVRNEKKKNLPTFEENVIAPEDTNSKSTAIQPTATSKPFITSKSSTSASTTPTSKPTTMNKPTTTVSTTTTETSTKSTSTTTIKPTTTRSTTMGTSSSSSTTTSKPTRTRSTTISISTATVKPTTTRSTAMSSTTIKLVTTESTTPKPTMTTTQIPPTTKKPSTTSSISVTTEAPLISNADISKTFESRKKSVEKHSSRKKQDIENNKKFDPYFDVFEEDKKFKTDIDDITKQILEKKEKEDEEVLVPGLRNVDLDFDVEVHSHDNTKNLQTTTKATSTSQVVKTTQTTTTTPLSTTDYQETTFIPTTTTEEPTTTMLIKAEWIAGDWSKCSTTCGVGARIRQVKCSASNHKLCNETNRPPPAELCNLRPCAKWSYGHWSKCSTLCGAGTRTKKIECIDPYTKKSLHPHHCRSLTPLTTVKISCLQSKCMPWKTSRWSSCSKVCGPGIQLRRVACSRYDQCDPVLKPQRKKSCFVKKCVQWRPLVWNKCSVHCGGGLQRRQVICIEQATGIQTNSSECSPGLKPHSVRKCNQGQCPVTDYDFSSCHKDRLSPSFCKLLESLGRCVQPSLAIQCCVTCKTSFLSVRHKDKIS